MTANSPSKFTLLKHALWVFILMLSTSGVLQAHELRPAVADLFISTTDNQKNANVTLRVNLEKLIAEIGPDHDDSDASPNRQRYDALRSMDSSTLTTEFEKFKSTFISAVNIQNNAGTKTDLQNVSIDIPDTGNIAIPRDSIITFDLGLQPTDQTLTWQWDNGFGEVIVRADNETGENAFSVLLAAGQRSSELSLGKITAVSVTDTVANYIIVGFQHIIPKGLDHILFVVGLFLLTAQPKALLLQVTVFTAAHTLTLMLGTLDILTVPGSVAEPLIAASIVFVCVENLLHNRATKWRLIIVFLFGLLHGLGFASVLGDVGLDMQHFFTALLSFNLGVELGQLAVIAGCYVIFGLFAKKPWYRQYISLPVSAIIGLIGLFWFVQRVAA